MRWPMTRVWVVKFDKHGFLPSTLPLAILCRLGLHSWQAVETKTISEVYQGSTISVDPDFGAKRVHRWQCRRDFCAAEFDAIQEQLLDRYREEAEHSKFLRETVERWKNRGR